jgi:hypothetical protein
MTKETTTFSPFEKFRHNLEIIREFEELSILSYGLTQQLLFKYPEKEVRSFSLPEPEKKQLSYSMAL